jgi:ribosomal protein S15P/S13E
LAETQQNLQENSVSREELLDLCNRLSKTESEIVTLKTNLGNAESKIVTLETNLGNAESRAIKSEAELSIVKTKAESAESRAIKSEAELSVVKTKAEKSAVELSVVQMRLHEQDYKMADTASDRALLNMINSKSELQQYYNSLNHEIYQLLLSNGQCACMSYVSTAYDCVSNFFGMLGTWTRAMSYGYVAPILNTLKIAGGYVFGSSNNYNLDEIRILAKRLSLAAVYIKEDDLTISGRCSLDYGKHVMTPGCCDKYSTIENVIADLEISHNVQRDAYLMVSAWRLRDTAGQKVEYNNMIHEHYSQEDKDLYCQVKGIESKHDDQHTFVDLVEQKTDIEIGNTEIGDIETGIIGGEMAHDV